jgi:hypothetical protein
VDHKEAAAVAEAALAPLRGLPYADLVTRLRGQSEMSQVTAPSGHVYNVELCGGWETAVPDHLRVWCNVDAGGLGSFAPLTRAFIVAPDGTLVDD